MLSQNKMQEKELYKICKDGEDIQLHQHFRGVRFIKDVFDDDYYSNTSCECIGKIGNSKRLLRTEDYCRYFYVVDGWGEKDGYLIAVNLGYEFFRNKPMGINELKKFIANPPSAHGMASTLKLHLDLDAAKEIISILENNSH